MASLRPSVWIDCSFATALARAAKRGQEGLPDQATIDAYREIYFRRRKFTSNGTTPGLLRA